MKECSRCHTDKPLEAFYKRSAMCKVCHSEYNKEHYKANKPAYVAKARKNTNKTRDWVQDYKSTNPCKDCGKFYHFCQMDFDHTSDNKSGCVSHLVTSGLKITKEEIVKCDLICSNCHRLRTFNRLKSG